MNLKNIHHHIKKRTITDKETIREYYIELYEAFMRSEKETERLRENMFAILETFNGEDPEWVNMVFLNWSQGDFIRFCEKIVGAIKYYKTAEKADLLEWTQKKIHIEKCKVYNYKKALEKEKKAYVEAKKMLGVELL